MTILADNFFPDLLTPLVGVPLKVAFYTAEQPTSLPYYTASGETNGTGYTAGGYSVTPAWSLTPASRLYELTISSLNIGAANFYADSMVLYRTDTGRVLAVMPTGGVNPVGGPLVVDFPTPLLSIRV